MLRTSMLLGRLRIALAHLSLSRKVVLLCLLFCEVQATHLRVFWLASRSFPFKLITTQIVTYVLLAVAIVPNLNLTRVLVMQAGALAITVMFYGLAQLGRVVHE